MKNLAFFMDSSVCLGCKACMIACKDKHNLPLGVNYRKVIEASGGEWIETEKDVWNQNVFTYYISMSCNHCEEPACVKACPTGACAKDEDGIVSIDSNRCVGCGYCSWNCPYSSPVMNKEAKHMTKCDFCRDYLAAGKEPACVSACPARALKFGSRDDIIAEYGMANIAPLPKNELTKPNLSLKPHKTAKPAGSNEVYFANKEEV